MLWPDMYKTVKFKMQLDAGGHFRFMQIAQRLQNCINRIYVLRGLAVQNQEKSAMLLLP